MTTASRVFASLALLGWLLGCGGESDGSSAEANSIRQMSIDSAWAEPVSPADAAFEFSDWCPRKNLGPIVNSHTNSGLLASDGGPAISRDGLSLYFHSNRTGGHGSFDLYVSQRPSVDAPWGPPQNLGPTINTSVVETVPALSRDGHWLFFNSLNRPGGFGGFDIWVSFRKNVHDDFAWEAPVNLGPGVNSASNDAGASYFENEGGVPLLFFGSNRPGGAGGSDIFFSAPQPAGSVWPAETVLGMKNPAGG